MRKLIVAALAAGTAIATAGAVVAQGPGQCGKGNKWDASNGKCVTAGKGSGSGSAGKGSGSGSGASKAKAKGSGSGSSAPKGKGSGSGSG
jgi:hypothetical protein